MNVLTQMLVKAATHKYFKRKLIGRDPKTGRARYRYYYQAHHGGGITAVEDIKAGEAFRLKDLSTGQQGHFHVKSVDGDKITVEHDESGNTSTMTKKEFQALLKREHGRALEADAKRKQETYERMKRETPKHIGLKAAKRRAQEARARAGIEEKKAPEKKEPSAKEPDQALFSNSTRRELFGDDFSLREVRSAIRAEMKTLDRGSPEQAALDKLNIAMRQKDIGQILVRLQNIDRRKTLENILKYESTGFITEPITPSGAARLLEQIKTTSEEVPQLLKEKIEEIAKEGDIDDAPLSPIELEMRDRILDRLRDIEPEKAEPSPKEEEPSTAPSAPALDRLTALLEESPELRNDPRVIALLGTQDKRQEVSSRQTSTMLLSLAGKTQRAPVRYQIVEAGDAIASHDPVGMNKRKDYPEGIQERRYESDKAERMKVIRNAQQFEPQYLINTNPDAMNGPPVMTPDGIVLGGNSRTMSAQRVYANHPDKAADYKKQLALQAETFGFTEEDVSKFKAPLLVRVYEPESQNKDHMAKLVRAMNESKTQGLDERTMGQAAAVKLRDGGSIDALRIALNKSGGSVNDLMTSPSEALDGLKEALFRDGVLTNENQNELLRQRDGTFNGRGRDFMNAMLVGYVIRDVDLLQNLSTASMNHLSTAIGKLASAGINEQSREAMENAIQVYHHAIARGRLKKTMDPQKRDEAMNDIMLKEQELFRESEAPKGETEEQKKQRLEDSKLARIKRSVSEDPLSSSFLKILTLANGSRKLSNAMDSFIELTKDTGQFDMFSGSTRISFDEAAQRLVNTLSREHEGVEPTLYKLNKAVLTLIDFMKSHYANSRR